MFVLIIVIVIRFNFIVSYITNFYFVFTNLMFIVYKNRSLAPSKNGKRPLLFDISNNVAMRQVVSPVQQTKKKACRNVKNVQIPEYKAIALSANDVQATQEVISEHVSIIH